MNLQYSSVKSFCFLALLCVHLLSAQVSVPFIGCKSDGQAGPAKSPAGTSPKFMFSQTEARKLAYYKAEYGGGVLAPRGWFCFGTYGSNGSVLYVSPQVVTAKQLFSDKWKGFSGPAIELAFRVGDTSGRFEVAQMIARVFPDYMPRTQEVIAENIEPASDFPIGPYPADKLTYKSRSMVEFATPPASEGLGSHTFLGQNSEPIFGLAALVFEYPKHQWPSLMHLSMRLPPASHDLMPIIIKQAEREVTEAKSQ